MPRSHLCELRLQRLGIALPELEHLLRSRIGEDLVTDAGRQWYEHSIRLLRDVDDARAAIRSSDVVSGSLVVSVSLTFGTALVVPRLRKLMTKHPELAVRTLSSR